MLALLDAVDHALNIARLGRGAADPADDNRWRRLVVVIGATASAIASDIRSGGTAAVDKLYKRTTIEDKEE